MKIRAALAEADPQDSRAKEGLANTQNYIGWIFRQKEDFAGALVFFKKGLALREMLSGKNPANEYLRFKIAESEANIGDVYTALAFRPRTSPEDDFRYCQLSESWNRKASPSWLQMNTQGKAVLGGAGDELMKINQNREKCGHLIAHLNHSP